MSIINDDCLDAMRFMHAYKEVRKYKDKMTDLKYVMKGESDEDDDYHSEDGCCGDSSY